MGELTRGNENHNLALATARAAKAGQYLTFWMGGEEYAIGILNIKEIIDFGDLTKVPMMPSFVRGVINLRGSVVPVVDLSARFGRAATQISKRTCIVIVETVAMDSEEQESYQNIGIMVDAVNEVIEIDAKDIEPAPTFGTGIRSDFVDGMAKRNKGFIVLLNVNRVLSVDEMASLGKMAVDDIHAGALV